MAWQSINISHDGAAAATKALPKVYRFLVDESLSSELAPELRRLGYDAIDLFALKRHCRATEDVFVMTRHERRTLLTEDRSFLEDSRFPTHQRPGVVVLPRSNGAALMRALLDALPFIRKDRELWEGMKILVREDGRITANYRNHTGAFDTARYKLRMTGPPLIWIADKPKARAGNVN